MTRMQEDGYYFGNKTKEKNGIILIGDSHARVLIQFFHLKRKDWKDSPLQQEE